MKKRILSLATAVVALCFSAKLTGQTAGVLTFTFTEVVKSSTYNGNQQHVLAAWIQDNAGAFIKTKLRYVGGGTNDHLPTWAANCGCTSSTNATGSACNKTDATTGATLSSFAARTFTWDAKNVSGTSNGTVVTDGTYKVALQSTWNHGTSGTATTTYTFTKGPTTYTRTVASDPNFGNILIQWIPTITTGVNEVTAAGSPVFNVYPNPTSGIFNVEYEKANTIKVLNTLGSVIYEEKVNESTASTKTIDLSGFAEGIYFINVSNDKGSVNRRIILSR
ncbi:MAG: T9SS type A sorting domain-containing protein [Bacteroidetes bacterium]|nr:T9SS type A sorting domain-containing protein [Bacteroidota bacterium]